uniref:AIG1-type G domain-containing protein n=1 Tax=Neogobius melanostomus TaxID=47308 RepID=A0A8C6S8B5_9GOBI
VDSHFNSKPDRVCRCLHMSLWYFRPVQPQTSTRIVILGKTGVGRSSLGNSILWEDLFPVSHAAISESTCCTETKLVNNKRSFTLIESPGFFDTCEPEESLKPALITCITDCAPGPHAFLIVLKVEKYTVHEKEIVEKISQYVSEEAFKFASVVFTHGDQLAEGMTIEEFTSQNEDLADLVRKCGGRCHVVDNKYWETGQDEYRNNKLQVARILETIEQIIQANGNSYYTNETLQTVEKELEEEEDKLRQGALVKRPLLEIRAYARKTVCETIMCRLTGTATGAILGALLGMLKCSIFSVGGLRTAAWAGAMRGAEMGYRVAGHADSTMGAVEKVFDTISNEVD